MQQHAETAMHAVSLGALLGSLTSYLPPVAAAVSIVWGCICIYESKTFKRMIAYLRSDF